MMDEEIQALVDERSRLRARGEYALADEIRKKLKALPEAVEILDLKSGATHWYRTMLSMEAREAFLSRRPG